MQECWATGPCGRARPMVPHHHDGARLKAPGWSNVVSGTSTFTPCVCAGRGGSLVAGFVACWSSSVNKAIPTGCSCVRAALLNRSARSTQQVIASTVCASHFLCAPTPVQLRYLNQFYLWLDVFEYLICLHVFLDIPTHFYGLGY